MGGFYTNYTLRGPSQPALAAVLAGRKAVVTPQNHGCVVVFDEASEGQDLAEIGELAARLSGELGCPVLAVVNHDERVFWYRLYEDGAVTDEYDSCPGCCNSSPEPARPAGGNAARLCAAFGGEDVAGVEQVLRTPSGGEAGYGFAFERHADLVWALGLPEFALGRSYASLERGDYPVGLSSLDVLRTV